MSQFPGGQRTLLELMWRISEESWSAGWMKDLEYELWRIVLTGPERYGQMSIEAGMIEDLRRLSKEAGGWIHFDDVDQEKWVDEETWAAMFEDWNSKRDSKGRA